MKKKMIIMLVAMFCIVASVKADNFTFGDINYKILSDEEVEVIAPVSGKYAGDIVIPRDVLYNSKTYRVTAIGDYAFQGATVTSVKLPSSGIVRIGKFAFNDCTGLTVFTLPETITSIGYRAFYCCDKLQHLYAYAKDPKAYHPENEAFSYINRAGNVCTLHVPSDCSRTYQADETFSKFTKMEEFVYDYALIIAGKKVTDNNKSDVLGDGAVNYDPTTKKLTIKGNITGKGFHGIDNDIDGLTIYTASDAMVEAGTMVPVISKGRVTITGTGKLTLSGNGYYAIQADGDVTIDHANLILSGSRTGMMVANHNLSINRSSLDVNVQSTAVIVVGAGKTIQLTDCYLKEPEGCYIHEGSDETVIMDQNNARSKKVVIAPGTPPADNGLAISATEATAILGKDFEKPTVTNPYGLSLEWKSSDVSVASVDQAGNVYLSAPGKTTITATFAGDSEYKAGSISYQLKVTSYCRLEFGIKDMTVTMGTPFTLPELNNPYHLALTYASSYENVATVNKTTGEVTLVGPGVTAITASWPGDEFIMEGSATYYLTVKKPDPVANDLAFSVDEVTAKIGVEFVEPTLSNPHALPLVWTSSEPSVATLNQSGKVTLVSPGNTVITAAFEGNDDYEAGSVCYLLMVQKGDKIANGLAFTLEKVTAALGAAFETPELINPNNLPVTYSSSYVNVATVNETTGEVTLVGPGTTAISASFAGNDDFLAGEVIYYLTVQYGDAVDNGLAFSVSEVTVKMGEGFDTPLLTNPHDLKVIWTSSDGNVAVVDENGGIDLVAPGITTISASFAGDYQYLAGSASYVLKVLKGAPVDNGLAFSLEEVTAKIGTTYELPKLINPNNLPVTYTSSYENVATVNETTGEVTLVGPGCTAISAIFAGNEDFLAGEVIYYLTVLKADAVANGLAFSVSEVTAKMGEEFESPQLTNPHDLMVIWTSSDTNVALVDEHGVVYLLAPGTTTISASFVGDYQYLAGSASYTLTVEEESEPEPVVSGDANGDGKVNVTDIVEIVNYILGHPSDKFLFEIADVNGDGVVNVTDIVMVVNIILSSDAHELTDGEADAVLHME